MATPIIPNNPNVPITPPTPGNVASLANPSTLSNLKNSVSPQVFGDQIKDTGKSLVVKGLTQSTLTRLYAEKASLIQEGIQLEIDHQKNLISLEIRNTPKKQVQNGQTIEIPAELNDEEYQNFVTLENQSYEETKKNIQKRKDQNQKAIDDFLKDPFKKQKDEIKKRKEALKQKLKRNKGEKSKARKAKIKAVLKNARKSLVPILTLLLTNKVAELIAQNSKIKKLVDDTNAIITEANESGDPTKLNNAKLARDNAIKIIQDNEAKITKIRDQINRISTYITIFNLIVTIISAIPIPTAVPPGIGIPTNLIIKFVKILDKANRILLSLSALIPILITCLEKAIGILQDLKAQLLNINGELEAASISGIPGTENLLNSNGSIAATSDNGIFPTEYKGFKFAIKDEERPKVTVRGGYKRRYAVAIDVNNVEVLKSDLSFTLDPNDLIDQLKIIIDRLGLKDGNSPIYNNPNNPSNSNNTDNNTIDGLSNERNIGSLISPASSLNSLVSSLTSLTAKPPQPEEIRAPAGTTATVPLSIQQVAAFTARSLVTVPPPLLPGALDAIFILGKNKSWQDKYKEYQRKNQNTTNSIS